MEPNEEVQLDFAEPLPDELNKDAYILVATDEGSKFPTAKVVTTLDVAIKFMQRCISNNGVPRRLICDQAQTFRAKKISTFSKTSNIKLLFAPVDEHKVKGVVKRMIQILKGKLGVIRINQSNTQYKLASDVAELIKILRITPHGITNISPFEANKSLYPTSSPNNFNWENAKHACLNRKNLTKPPLPAEIMHDLQQWSEDEVSVNRRSQMTTKAPGTSKTTTQLTPGAQSRKIIEINQ